MPDTCGFHYLQRKKDTSNPNWFVNSYNEVAKTRGLPSLPLIFRGIEGGI